jgi:hypothetical protein
MDYLNDLWSFYFHNPFDTDWTIQSYKKVIDITTVQEFWSLHNQLDDKVNKGMFFCMREHIFPCWDDPLNINGNCLSVKVLKQNAPKYWEELMMSLLGETLLKSEYRDEHWSSVNGISISPKKSFCIIKVWLSNADISSRTYFNLPIEGQYGEIIFKLNNESIQSTHLKTGQ